MEKTKTHFAKTEEIKTYIREYVGENIKELSVHLIGNIAWIGLAYTDFKPERTVRRAIEDKFPLARFEQITRELSEEGKHRAVEVFADTHEEIYLKDADGALRPVDFLSYLESQMFDYDFTATQLPQSSCV